MADNLGLGFLETSAKKSKNVDEAFKVMTKEVIANYQNTNKSNSLTRKSNNSLTNMSFVGSNDRLKEPKCICNL